MSDLIPVNLSVSKYGDDKSFASVSTDGNFLPRIMLMNATSNFVKEGKINQGHYGFVRSKDAVDDLTREVNVLVVSWRPKALDMSTEDVVASYNPNSELFKQIAAKSEEPNSGCMFGPEFLLWIPSISAFGGFLMGSKTARRAASELKALMTKSATLKSTLIKTQRHSWFGPVITICSAPLTPPEPGLLEQEALKFNNPTETEKDIAVETRER